MGIENKGRMTRNGYTGRVDGDSLHLEHKLSL